MPEDRLDDAIAAVTRAVERIEAATRGVLDASAPADELDLPAPLPPQPRKPPPPAFSSAGAGFAARPTTALGVPDAPLVAPSWSDYEPQAGTELPIEDDLPIEHTPIAPDDLPARNTLPIEHAPPAPATADQPTEPLTRGVVTDGSETVHELVGQIIARTQQLEEHLDAARGLRSDIIVLVSRIAAAAEQGR